MPTLLPISRRKSKQLVGEIAKYNSKLKRESGAEFSILTALDCGYALELKLAIKINDEKRNAMTSSGWDFSPFHDNSNWILPIPATFCHRVRRHCTGAIRRSGLPPAHAHRSADCGIAVALLSGKSIRRAKRV